jgi:hypothetical protein
MEVRMVEVRSPISRKGSRMQGNVPGSSPGVRHDAADARRRKAAPVSEPAKPVGRDAERPGEIRTTGPGE